MAFFGCRRADHEEKRIYSASHECHLLAGGDNGKAATI